LSIGIPAQRRFTIVDRDEQVAGKKQRTKALLKFLFRFALRDYTTTRPVAITLAMSTNIDFPDPAIGAVKLCKGAVGSDRRMQAVSIADKATADWEDQQMETCPPNHLAP